MSALAISPVRPSGAVVSLDASTPSGDMEVTFSVAGAEFTGDASFLVPLLLSPAMRSGQEIAIEEPVSPRMLTGARHVAEIFSLWQEDLDLIGIDAPARPRHPSRPEGAAAFFSAGVDSFHTAVRHRDELTHLIFVHGVFDLKVEEGRDVAVARRAAREMGLPLIEVTTSARVFADAWNVSLTWSHGNILAAIALLFESTFGTVWVPSSYSYDQMPHWGTHPLIDPLWSTESLQIVHDGSEATRPMKVAAIAESDVAMRHLRVCHGARRRPGSPVTSGSLNCGRCEKCVRTMINLRAVGALDRCETFAGELDLEDVASWRITSPGALANIAENLRTVEGERPDAELAAALRACLRSNDLDEDTPVDARELAMQLRKAERQIEKSERRLDVAEKRAARHARRLDAMRRSWSWRVTAPLRVSARKRS